MRCRPSTQVFKAEVEELLTEIVNDRRAGWGSTADGVGLSREWRTPLGSSALPDECRG